MPSAEYPITPSAMHLEKNVSFLNASFLNAQGICIYTQARKKSYKLLFLSHRSLISNITQKAVIFQY